MPPEPLILAFDTSAAHCAAALLSGDRVLGEKLVPMAKGQAENLFPLLETLLSDANKSWSDLDRIGVGIGPGNFTGIRISVAAARGLALSLNIPAIGVSTFRALALDTERPVMVILNARAGQVYFQKFGENCDFPESLAKAADLPENLDPNLHVIVDGAVADLMPQVGGSIVDPQHTIAVSIAKIARSSDPLTSGRPAPLYLRSPDAAPPRDNPPLILD